MWQECPEYNNTPNINYVRKCCFNGRSCLISQNRNKKGSCHGKQETSKESQQLCAFKLTITASEKPQGSCAKPNPSRRGSEGTAATSHTSSTISGKELVIPLGTKPSQREAQRNSCRAKLDIQQNKHKGIIGKSIFNTLMLLALYKSKRPH